MQVWNFGSMNIFVEKFDYSLKQDSLKKELIRDDLCLYNLGFKHRLVILWIQSRLCGNVSILEDCGR